MRNHARLCFSIPVLRIGTENRLGNNPVLDILKGRVRDILIDGIPGETADPREIAEIVASISSHLLRVGCDQDLFATGVDIGAIMQRLRWQSPRQPLVYARHLAPSTSNFAAAMRRYR